YTCCPPRLRHTTPHSAFGSLGASCLWVSAEQILESEKSVAVTIQTGAQIPILHQPRTAAAPLTREIIEDQTPSDRFVQVKREARCLRRAVSLMGLSTALAHAGLGYAIIFVPEIPQSFSEFLMEPVMRGFCALAVASLTCMLVFSCLELLCRR